jgi:hypothetical protein
MKIATNKLRKIIQETLLEQGGHPAQGDIYKQWAKSSGGDKFDKSEEFEKSLQDSLYKLQANMTGITALSKMKSVPLAIRMWARFYADNNTPFTEKDLNDKEASILKDLCKWKYKRYMKKNKEENVEKIPFRYQDYHDITKRELGDSTTIMSTLSGDDKGIIKNFELGLGQFWIYPNKEGKSFLVKDNYDFRSSSGDKWHDIAELEKEYKNSVSKSLIPLWSAIEAAYAATLKGDSAYTALRDTALKSQMMGLDGYPVKINIKGNQ